MAETNHTNLEAAQHARVTALNRDAIRIRGALRSALEAIAQAATGCADHLSTATAPSPAMAAPAKAAPAVAGR